MNKIHLSVSLSLYQPTLSFSLSISQPTHSLSIYLPTNQHILSIFLSTSNPLSLYLFANHLTPLLVPFNAYSLSYYLLHSFILILFLAYTVSFSKAMFWVRVERLVSYFSGQSLYRDDVGWTIQRVSYITANIYCKSRNLPNTDVRSYSIDLWLLLRHSVTKLWSLHGTSIIK